MKRSDPLLNIIITEPDGYNPRAIALLSQLGKVELCHFSDRRFPKVLRTADVLVVKLGLKINRVVLAQAPQLKIIATNTTGLNHIDLEEAKQRHVAVISLRGHTAFLEKIQATPELTWGLLLALVRKIPWAFESVKQGRWNRNSFAGHELQGKVLGILGLGRIGKIMARYGQAFGMAVAACDPNISAAVMKKFGVKKTTMDELFCQADVLSVHVLHTPAMDRLVQARHFRLMKPTAYFINTARGELVDESAMLKALQEKHLAGAALDVMSREDQQGKHLRRHPLRHYAQTHDNLLIVPHLGGAAIEAWQATEEYLAKLVVRHFQNDKRK